MCLFGGVAAIARGHSARCIAMPLPVGFWDICCFQLSLGVLDLRIFRLKSLATLDATFAIVALLFVNFIAAYITFKNSLGSTIHVRSRPPLERISHYCFWTRSINRVCADPGIAGQALSQAIVGRENPAARTHKIEQNSLWRSDSKKHPKRRVVRSFLGLVFCLGLDLWGRYEVQGLSEPDWQGHLS